MNARAQRWGAAGAFVLLFALSFAFRAGDFHFDLGIGLGWVALVPFVWMLRGLSVRAAFRWASLAATLSFAGILYWLVIVVHVHGQAPLWAGVTATFLLAGVLGLHTGLAAALTVALARRAGALAWAVLPAAWVVTEHLISFDLFGGFPWGYLGYSAHSNGPMLELASLGGVYGLSFLLAAVASLLARGRLRTAIVVVAIAHASGFTLRLTQLDPPQEGGALRAGLVQASIPQHEKWDRALARKAFDRHLELSRLVAADGELDLLLWPEASVPVLLDHPDYQEYAEQVRRLTDEIGIPVVVGSLGVDLERRDMFNSVFVLSPGQGFVDRYDKSHLVPFGEYVPLREVLGMLSAVAAGMAFGDATPGPGPRVLKGMEGLGPDHAPTALICYEVIYPSLVREAVRGGGRLLLNLTNDAWYERSSAPHQFLAIAAMRSAEHGLPMLRAANTGVSAVIDAGGIVLQETPIFEAKAVPARIPPKRAGPTLYTRFGNWVVWFSWGFLIIVGGIGLAGRGHQRDSGGDRDAQPESGGATEASLTSTANRTG